MRKLFLPILAIAQLTYSCGNTTKEQDTGNTQAETAETAVAPVADEPKSVLTIFPELSAVQTTAKAGEYVLAPRFDRLEEYLEDEKASLNYGKAKMTTPGDKTSELTYVFDGIKEIPNKVIIPIPAGQTAKKGDILLTWWQSGSGLQRAIVTDDSDPNAPEVHYLDLDWDLQEKGGKMTEKIEENSFTPIDDVWQPGITLAVKEGTDYKKYTLLAVYGDKVLVSGFVNDVSVLDKSACTPLHPTPTVKVGDVVQAPWASGSFRPATVNAVKPEYGRAVLAFELDKGSERTIPLGDITTGL